MDRPGLAVALILGCQQIAIGRIQIDPDRYLLATLEDLIVAARMHRAEVFPRIDPVRLRYRLLDDGVHAAQGNRPIQYIAKEFHHAPKGAVAQQHQRHHHLPQPRLGHWQIE
jgi:hypothetical protein